MTPEEKHLWYDFLKHLPLTVKRQKVIGTFIVDFYIASARLAIEVDGRQHTTTEHIERDSERDSALSERGIQVFRCTNEQVKYRFKEICDSILNILQIKFTDLKS
jgi:very-short-patch-repair endonuclease